MDEQWLGKIVRCDIGGIDGVGSPVAWNLAFRGQSCGVGDTKPCDVAEIRPVLDAAKVANLHDLIGKPVEVTIKGGVLSSWRILTEVL